MRDASRRRSHRPHGTEQAFEMVSQRVSPEQLLEIAMKMPTRRFIVWKRFYLDGWTMMEITQELRSEGFRASACTCARERLAADAWLLDKVENVENPGVIGTFVCTGGTLRFKPDETIMAVVHSLRGGFVRNPMLTP